MDTLQITHFDKRRDRFEHFERMESPSVNITFRLEVPDFRAACKAHGFAPFHFFLFAVTRALMGIENFRYRIYRDEVIMIERVIPSYTVTNHNNDLNFASFVDSDDVATFIARSIAARDIAVQTEKLTFSPEALDPRQIKDHFFTTCTPWLDFTSLQHPMANFGAADIPLIAWGKITDAGIGKLTLPFSVQAHHGFVDGYHMHLLSRAISSQLDAMLGNIGRGSRNVK